MGLLSRWQQERRAKQAAKELWQVVRGGVMLEIPLVFDQSDLTMQAISILTREHPQVQLRYMLAKGLVLGIHNGGEGQAISHEAMQMLIKGGNVQAGGVTVEELLAGQEAWLRKQGLDPKQQEREAQEARMARERIEIGAMESAADAGRATLNILNSSPITKAVDIAQKLIDDARKPGDPPTEGSGS